jgi:hypothetical protein
MDRILAVSHGLSAEIFNCSLLIANCSFDGGKGSFAGNYKPSVYKDEASLYKDGASLYKDGLSLYKDGLSLYKDEASAGLSRNGQTRRNGAETASTWAETGMRRVFRFIRIFPAVEGKAKYNFERYYYGII